VKNIRSSVFALCTLSVLSAACMRVEVETPLKAKRKASNKVNNQGQVDAVIGDEKQQFHIMDSQTLKSTKSIHSIYHPLTKKALASLPQGSESAQSIARQGINLEEEEKSLLVGMPIGLVGQQNIFGGVITKVTDRANESLGTLKLTDLSPLNVRTLITRFSNGSPALSLVGCAFNCKENSQQVALLSLPIVGYSAETQMIILDLAPIGRELDLIAMLDPNGQYTQLKSISSTTTNFEYDVSTLVFDIKNKMIPVTASEDDQSAPVTSFTVRWYLKLNSTFNPAFEARTPTPGVGFFTTERGASSKITRFSTTNNGSSVHYYIKHVPEEWKKVFAGSLDNWNVEFKKVLNRDLLTYEFIDANDPRSEEIVTGDIRYNVIEWDLVNKAGYGGLGPSIANQFTGETLSANVLVQGPTIIELYTKWFGISRQVRELKASGQVTAANQLMKKFNTEAQKKIHALNKVKFSIKLGKSLEMNIPAQRPELEDPIVKGHFDLVPAGISYEDYMNGYFYEIIEHELGHNLGLRHNFKGNLGAVDNGEKGSVSRSVMEYLGRPFRHLNSIGLYDKMAIAYGYAGIEPRHLNWFCTDEDQASDLASMKTKSPECSKSDATSDPFSFLEGRLSRAVDLLVDTKSTAAPVWKLAEIKSQVDEAVNGLSAYALSAERTAATWTNFFGRLDRPENNKEEIKAYVLKSFKKRICDPKLASVIASKATPEARELAANNLVELRKAIAEKTKSYGLFSPAEFDCSSK
jgi:hypothetical protein